MKHEMSSHVDVGDSAVGKLGDNQLREHKKQVEYALRMDKDATVEIEGSAKYHDYRQNNPGNPYGARNDHVTPPAPAVGASSVYQGKGTN